MKIKLSDNEDNKNLELIEYSNELEDRIDKAIEYIENYITEQGETLPYYNYQKVIAILKGDDKK